METPFPFLWLAARVALQFGAGAGGRHSRADLSLIVLDFLKQIDQAPPPAANSTDAVCAAFTQPAMCDEVRRQLELVAQASSEQLRPAIKKLVKQMGADQSKEQRQALADYLAKTPNAVRLLLRRGPFTPGNPEDLLEALPGEGISVPIATAADDDAEAEIDITLTCTEGVNRGRSYQFPGHDTFLVGRAKNAHFQLPPDDKYFSRVHFMVELNPPQCRLMDMGSRNGTYLRVSGNS